MSVSTNIFWSPCCKSGTYLLLTCTCTCTHVHVCIARKIGGELNLLVRWLVFATTTSKSSYSHTEPPYRSANTCCNGYLDVCISNSRCIIAHMYVHCVHVQCMYTCILYNLMENYVWWSILACIYTYGDPLPNRQI